MIYLVYYNSMLAASHALIGASLAKLIPNPYLAIPLNIAGHFLGDLLPHWDFRTRKTNRTKLTTIAISLGDAFLGYLLGWLIFAPTVNHYYLLLMMFLSQLPDWLEAPYNIFNWNFFPFSSIKHLQSRLHHKLNLPWGLIWQILVAIGFILLALRP